jgi:hypothetical protein
MKKLVKAVRHRWNTVAKGLSKPNFRLVWAKGNMAVLKRMKRGDAIGVDRWGRLHRLETKSQRIAGSTKNILLMGASKRRVCKAIEWTLRAFCHEAKNPLHLPHLRAMREKTNEHAEAAIVRVADLFPDVKFLERLKKIVRKYNEASIIQERILSGISKRIGVLDDSWAGCEQDGELCLEPLMTKSGCSGSYIIQGRKKALVGIFKPCDEEIGSPNNPSELRLRGVFGSKVGNYGIRNGEGVHREVATYVVDRTLKLGIVPKTCYAEFSHGRFYEASQGYFISERKTKQGSLQEYIVGYKQVSKLSLVEIEQIPADQMHRLLLLDLLIGNMDRNTNNVLTDGSTVRAIDHGLSFPSKHQYARLSHWSRLPQMRLTFFPSLKEKIDALQSELLCGKLRKRCAIYGDALERMRERIAVLQEGARRGLSLKQLIDLMISPQMQELVGLHATLHEAAARIVRQHLQS